MYIKREDAIRALTEVLFDEPPYLNSIEKCETFARKTLKDIPSVEPKKWFDDGFRLGKQVTEYNNKPKQGEWIDMPRKMFKCSECGQIYQVLEPKNFCPNCGARMKGADDEYDK